MKRYISIIFYVSVCLSVLAVDPSQIRVYINPGHGSWTSADRAMNTLREVDGRLRVVNPNATTNTPDTTGFYESNTNLRKCLGLAYKLQQYGLLLDDDLNQHNSNPYRIGAALDMSNNICMSHVTVGPYPQDAASPTAVSRSLSEISQEVESNNFDLFVSVHSNAATEGATVNYPLVLYRGTEAQERVEGSKEMAALAMGYMREMPHQPWTNKGTYKGDVTFYGMQLTSTAGYLSALRHNVPGVLIEGYFHTYQPSRQRAMNFDVDRMEGYAYGRAVADYFGLGQETTGDIYGVVRDANERFTHQYYKPNGATKDVYKPLNGVTVTLSRDGREIDTYTTNANYNGAFVFPELQPGVYAITLTAPGYEIVTTEVEVKAAQTSAPDIFLHKNR